jgi:hypothetical protein
VGTEQGITRELTLGEVLNRTYELYRNNFVNFVLLFAVVELIIGVIGYIIFLFTRISIGMMSFPSGSGFALGALFATLAVTLLVTFLVAVVFIPVAEGATIKMTSGEINGQKIDLMGAVSFAFSKLLSLWVIFIVVGLIVVLGLIALIIPGIILAIMFALSIPVLLIEQKGVFASMSRSRQLVGGRWLKTFATFLVLGIIIAIVSYVLNLVSLVAGPGSGILGSILSALYQPVVPIALTVYYYSNAARTSGAQPSQPTVAPVVSTGAAPQPGMKFCPNCGTQMASSAMFCPKCGARQP